jgi:hypothetical protein
MADTMKRPIATILILIIMSLGWAWGPLARLRESPARADDELEKHLEDLRLQVEDTKNDITRRELLTLEMAATLDRAAQSATTPEARRARWTEAIQLLGRFGGQNPSHPRTREFTFQAAVYLWARARSWQQEAEFDPTDLKAREEAIKDHDGALVRLRAIQERLPTGINELLVQNVQFRLAQALADRAEFDPEGSETRRKREDEALKALERPVNEPSLRGFAHLLRAELLGRLGCFDQAMGALESAAKAKPAPPESDLLAARIAVLGGQKRFEEAIRAIDAAPLDAVAKDVLAVRVRLTERASRASGPERSAAESALFQRVGPLRASGTPEARMALIELARRVIEPDANQRPEAWEAVAEGALALGDLLRASKLEAKAGARAEAMGRPEEAATLRLRSGAYLYQAERYDEADALLTQVADDPKAGAARAGAGMLRAMARGRSLAMGRPGASRKAYNDALEAQIRDFPSDPSTQEARWLLGRLRLAASDRDAAQSLWSAIAAGSPRWIDARLAISRLDLDDLDVLRIGNDRKRVETRYEEARTFLTTSRELAKGAVERAELELALARLELTPIVGHPDQARLRCDQIQHSASQPEQRDRARRLQIVALAELNRFVETEQAARDESNRSRPADLLEIARLLDHVASDSESDLRIRRFGLILRVLLNHALDRPDELPEDQAAELRLRLSRSLLFRGDDVAARKTLTTWNGRPPENDDRFLKDLADTYFRLEAYAMVIDVERLRLKRLTTGSPAWFEARYQLALAEYRAGKAKDALHLIDATSILHPDLGGGQLREKFLRLRQRIGPDQ